jgi:hypothetical protein
MQTARVLASASIAFIAIALSVAEDAPAQTSGSCTGQLEAQCSKVPGCRWLSPAGNPTVAAAGCYRACSTDAECAPPTHCHELKVDPCPDGDCTHAPVTARACLR